VKYELTEAQLRYLRRIAHKMLAASTGEITITLHQGGVRAYKESQSLTPLDLEESDGEFVRTLDVEG
jgi:hypothetical protein